MTAKPEVTSVGDAMQFVWPEHGIEVELDRFHAGHEEITCDIYVRSRNEPNPGLVHFGRLNLMTARTRAELAKLLTERDNSVCWADILLQLCTLAVQRYRDGDPAVDLRTVDPYVKTRWLLYPYIERGGPTILYAEGGVGKSVLALWMGLQVALGPRDAQGHVQPSSNVLYLDWETSPEVHAERMNGLCAGMNIDLDARPPITYRRMGAGLPSAAATVRRDIDKLRAGLVIVDSLAFAGEGAPEDSGTAVQLFQCIRSFPVPALCIHHKRKSISGMRSESQRDRLFGSVYYLNSARLVWEADSNANEDSDAHNVALINVKANDGRLLKRHALTIHFTNRDDRIERIEVKPIDMLEAGFDEKVSVRDRVVHELARGALSAQALADNLGMEERNLSSRLSKLKRSGVIANTDRGQWCLPAKEAV